MKFLKNRGGKDMKESSGIKNKNKKIKKRAQLQLFQFKGKENWQTIHLYLLS
jgi:hypothetical protein